MDVHCVFRSDNGKGTKGKQLCQGLRLWKGKRAEFCPFVLGENCAGGRAITVGGMRHEASVALLFAGLLAYAGGLVVWVMWAGRAAVEFLAR